jgi:hypothetical protein
MTVRLVSREGELIEDAEARIQYLEDQIAGMQRELNAWRLRYRELERANDERDRRDALWPIVMALFDEWREATRHERSQWSPSRFRMAKPYLRTYGREIVRCGIHGIALDPFKTKRANGTVERHDGWALLFRDTDHFERYVNRAPLAMLAALPKLKKPVRVEAALPQIGLFEIQTEAT